jgi:hypothetical protein
MVLFSVLPVHLAAEQSGVSSKPSSLGDLIKIIREKAARFQDSSGMHTAYNEFIRVYGLQPNEALRTRFSIIRVLFEATRDAGLWNLHWAITNLPPNSDQIWQQWQKVRSISYTSPTATAECDELSALFAFLSGREGIRGVGLLWPASNHTVSVWTLAEIPNHSVRVVVPTTQIFLEPADMFGTRKFNPWRQKVIYEYVRKDAPDSLILPASLLQFFSSQLDKYIGADDRTLQRLRYLREAVFLKFMTPQQAADEAAAGILPGNSQEDREAVRHFVDDMTSRNASPTTEGHSLTNPASRPLRERLSASGCGKDAAIFAAPWLRSGGYAPA